MERIGPRDFEGQRLRRSGTWVIAFLADWCPFCRTFRPMFERFDGKANLDRAVADVTDFASPLWDRFRIEVVPSILVFQDGELVHRVDGIPMEGLAPEDLENLRGVLQATVARPLGSRDPPA